MKVKLSLFVVLCALLNLELKAQQEDKDLIRIEVNAKKYKAVNLKIDTLKYEYSREFPYVESLRHIVKYDLPKIKESLVFIRNEPSSDSVFFKKKVYVFTKSNSDLELDNYGEKFFLVSYKGKQYLIFETGIMGSTGRGAAWGPYLIFNLKKNKQMLLPIGKEMKTYHFIDHKNDGVLDLIYHNWKDKDCILNLESGKIIEIDD
jgi:hypothetical protein